MHSKQQTGMQDKQKVQLTIFIDVIVHNTYLKSLDNYIPVHFNAQINSKYNDLVHVTCNIHKAILINCDSFRL